MLGLEAGGLTWDGRNRRAIAEEKKQSNSLHSAILGPNAVHRRTIEV
jgi:hypothetical protein